MRVAGLHSRYLNSRLVKKHTGVTASLRYTVLDNEQLYNHKVGMCWWLTLLYTCQGIFLLQLFDIINFTLTIKEWFKAKNELNPTNPTFPSIYQVRFVLSSSMWASLKSFALQYDFLLGNCIWIWMYILLCISGENLGAFINKKLNFSCKNKYL